MAYSAPDERLNKILRMLGVDSSRAISVDIHIRMDEAVTLTVVQYSEWDENAGKELDRLVETTHYRLEPIVEPNEGGN